MSGDPFKYWQQLQQGEFAAFKSVPLAHSLWDSVAQAAGQLQSSSNLNLGELFEVDEALAFMDKYTAGPQSQLMQELTQIFTESARQSYFGGSLGGAAGQAQRQAQIDQAEKKVEAHKARTEHRYQTVALARAINKHEDEKGDQLRRMAESDMASINGYSDEKIDAMNELTYAFIQHPEDLELNA